MKTIVPVLLILSAVLLSVQACKHLSDPIKKTDDSDTNSTSTGNPCSSDTAYYSQVQALLNSSCLHAGCHNSQDMPDSIDLSSYSSILNTTELKEGDPLESEIYKVLFETGDKAMPPYPYAPLNDEQKNLIRDWIAQGALENYCDGCDTTNVTYSGSISKLMATSCNPCHNDNLTQASINLTSYSGVKGIVDDTRLLRSIQHDTGVVAMPYNLPKLDDCAIRTIELWINDGAQDN